MLINQFVPNSTNFNFNAKLVPIFMQIYPKYHQSAEYQCKYGAKKVLTLKCTNVKLGSLHYYLLLHRCLSLFHFVPLLQ